MMCVPETGGNVRVRGKLYSWQKTPDCKWINIQTLNHKVYLQNCQWDWSLPNYSCPKAASRWHSSQRQKREKKRVNTHKELFKYERLLYGVASAPAVLQRIMDQVLQGVNGVVCYLDDMLITVRDFEEHLQNLEEVLKRLQRSNFKVNKDKCAFLKNWVSWGHCNKGYTYQRRRQMYAENIPVSQNVSELRLFLSILS